MRSNLRIKPTKKIVSLMVDSKVSFNTAHVHERTDSLRRERQGVTTPEGKDSPLDMQSRNEAMSTYPYVGGNV